MLTIPTAEPFFIPGGRTGCLLIHGFTGTPKEMRWLGEYLSGQGHSVLAVRLAGHATQLQDMVRTRWQDWLASVEDGWNLLRCNVDRVYVMGLSLGGALALIAAARYPVTGVVAISAPYSLDYDWRIRYARLFSAFIPRVGKGPSDWRNPEAARTHVDYPYFPTRSIAELNNALIELRRCLPQITVPALLVHSLQDESVLPRDAESIYAALGSRDKQLMWIENSGHVIIREPQRAIAFQAIADFLRRTSS